MEKITAINKIYLPERGITFEIPPHWTENTTVAETGQINYGHETEEKMKAIRNDKILKYRYPTPRDGERFMKDVCPEWRMYLYQKGLEMTDAIVECAKKAGTQRIAVVMFGSVSKNLVRRPDHPDPSNIDLMILADEPYWDRDLMLDCIRTKREDISREILKDQHRASDNPIEGVGVIAQNLEKASKDEYISIRQRIIACARPLYDPENIWHQVEHQALPYIELNNLAPLERKRARKNMESRRYDQLPQFTKQMLLSARGS